MARLAVIGAGWAGLAAAVEATGAGHEVTVYETTRQPGGRARTVQRAGETFDNGQHILIGAYVETLALMRRVGVDPQAVLTRLPLTMTLPDGSGLRLPPGPPAIAFVRGVLGNRRWPLSHRWALLARALSWRLKGFRCPPDLTMAALCAGLPPTVWSELLDPLCVAALNTPAAEASAQVFLWVLREALFSGPGAADLLLPSRPLGELLPDPACVWLQARGARLCMGHRVTALGRLDRGWSVDGEAFDAIVVACSAVEAARLARPHAADWAQCADGLEHEPIVTVVVDVAGARLPASMICLPEGPAQFAFDHGALGMRQGRFTFVVSGARAWTDAGLDATVQATLAQARCALPAIAWPDPRNASAAFAERRATFRCTPALRRPAMAIAPGLLAAGDYVDGPYPATLEGAVRSGLGAARMLD